MKSEEINFDGLVGPTHHFGGYSYGNIASMEHKKQISHPKKAALEGLTKMKLLADMGIPQAILPPRVRPSFSTLRLLGFEGTDSQIFAKAAEECPALFYELCSSSFMWAANSATVSPSTDTQDGKVHMTVANLQSHFHRSIEAEETYRLFQILFPDKNLFTIHPPLPRGGDFGDEGAANHTRFSTEYSEKGVHLFVYGKSAFEAKTHRFPFRQAKEASEAVSRQHGLDLKHTVFARQNHKIIEEGVFHNDVISVGNRNLFLYHEHAFENTEEVVKNLQKIGNLTLLCVTEKMLSIKAAVQSYFFNSQLVTVPNGTDLLIAPKECASLKLEWLPLKILFVDLTESMQNGGGPACLRLRIILNEKEKKSVHPSIFFSEKLYSALVEWVEKHYRENLSWEDLKDPALLQEQFAALDSLTQILHLGSFYAFQREACRHA